jgi:hypothetical protein
MLLLLLLLLPLLTTEARARLQIYSKPASMDTGLVFCCISAAAAA